MDTDSAELWKECCFWMKMRTAAEPWRVQAAHPNKLIPVLSKNLILLVSCSTNQVGCIRCDAVAMAAAMTDTNSPWTYNVLCGLCATGDKCFNHLWVFVLTMYSLCSGTKLSACLSYLLCDASSGKSVVLQPRRPCPGSRLLLYRRGAFPDDGAAFLHFAGRREQL